MKLSVVATLYGSAPYIREFCARADAAARHLAGEDYEIVLVNDGSPDDSLAVAVAQQEAYPRLTIVDLARNFGHHRAMMTGLAHAGGEIVYLLDVDLEEQPEWLDGFAAQMARDRCDVVYGVQTRRKGGAFERWSGKWFFRVFNFLAGVRLPENATTARLMTRRFVDALLRHEEREVFIDGLWHITGFDQRPQDVVKLGRPETSYTLRRRVALAVNAVTSFSNVPLILIFHLGLAISLLAVAYIVYLVINRFGFAVPLTGWTSVMASIWLLGGLIIVFIGVVGIYLSKLFAEVKRRPYAIIRAIYERKRN